MNGGGKVLISGAGIAGASMAYWLLAHGLEPTIVERAPAFRSGGYIIDFWGVGYDVAEKMNLLPELRSRGYDPKEVRLIDKGGRKVGGFSADIFRASLSDRFLSILRGDLAEAIYDRVKDRVETIYSDSISAIEQDQNGVDVSFASGSTGRFDYLIGADGLHSGVRNIIFGAEEQFEKDLGYVVAAFSVEGYRPRDEGVYVAYSTPGKQITRFAARNDRTVFFLVFRSPLELSESSQGRRLDAGLVRRVLSGAGWESDAILAAMESCDDLYVDAVSQIRMPSWHQGRVALVGDAAFCPSLLAGQGSALAMAGSYILCGELKRAGYDHVQAFQKYEEKFKPFITRKQIGAESFGKWFAPETRFQLFLRDQMTKLFAIPFFSDMFVAPSVADRYELEEY